MSSEKIEAIRLKGAQQNNLKGFDLEIPVGKLVVVTGLSGAGKSSLVFETLHAEGQRRYVETFSPYTRQFLELLPEAKIDEIENVRPSIAVKQGNSVKTSRSTVGTMTELCDWMKIWFTAAASLFDPETGEEIRCDSPASVWEFSRERLLGNAVVIAFPLEKPTKISWEKILKKYKESGFTKFVAKKKIFEISDVPEAKISKEISAETKIFIVADRLKIDVPERERFIEATTNAFKFGNGILALFVPEKKNSAAGTTFSSPKIFTENLVSPASRKHFRPASPSLFSFNSPLGACQKCRGFGRIIELDWKKIIPDETKNLKEGVFAPFSGAVYGESQNDLLRACKKKKIPTNIAWKNLAPAHKKFVLDGDPDWRETQWQSRWYGVRRFFEWLEMSLYKMHIRVFISRFRAYTKCPSCAGTRFSPESLCWKFRGNTLPELYSKSVDELLALLKSHENNKFSKLGNDKNPAQIALSATIARLEFLQEVGLGFLTLDRQSRTLSGGEIQRVNLTSCLGASLSNTLFILDEPSVGLHSRDLAKMISILKKLVAAGNTVVVVEHDESVMAAADFLVEIGPEPGKNGGNLVYAGDFSGILKCENSITGTWLSGKKTISGTALKPASKQAKTAFPRLKIAKVFAHNLKNFACEIPLKKLVGICGVSGSGKSTLLNNVLAQFATEKLSEAALEDDFELPPCVFKSEIPLEKIVLVDQSPLSKTPRSNPALFCGIWTEIRELLAGTPEAKSAGLTSSSFSYNSGDGRCFHCRGSGWETVEMQFLSDVFIPCPVCEGRRFRNEILKFSYRGKNASELLQMTISEALEFFSANKKIVQKLKILDEIGLGYLTLGQPLNTLSGGEAQRLKLVKFLAEIAAGTTKKNRGNAEKISAGTTLLLLDEPTTGLHRDDISRLLQILKKLVAAGNSVVVIEHQIDVLAACDWLLELGPEGGASGGELVFSGTPFELSRAQTATSPFLKNYGNAKFSVVPAQKKFSKIVPEAASNLQKRVPAISLKGVREHNLKNISLEIPLNEFAVVTGISGSGKSSLAFDVIFAEGQRRFMECMSAYARQFVEQLPKPDADEISGIPPTVSIEQRQTRGSAKSTVATITEVAQYLRLLFSKIGEMHNPSTGTPLVRGNAASVFEQISSLIFERGNAKFLLAAPLIRSRKGHHKPIADWAQKHGFQKIRADGKLVETRNFSPLDRYKEHSIEAIVDEFSLKKNLGNAARKDFEKEIFDAVNRALKIGKGACLLLSESGKALRWFSRERIDPESGESFPELEPKDFSWNSPRGWCEFCHGHGKIVERFGSDESALNENSFSDSVTKKICPHCSGTRLNPLVRAVTVSAKIVPEENFSLKKSRSRERRSRAKNFSELRKFSLPEILSLPPNLLLSVLEALEMAPRERAIAARILPEIRSRLRFLGEVGLGYLTLDRASDTLSGGEAQRIRLAAQLGSNLSGVLYVLDEPSIGLHPSDNSRLIESLKNLRKRGNSLLVVEHDEETMRAADRVIDLGPGAGTAGGEVLFNGKISGAGTRSQTLNFLKNGISHPMNGKYRSLGNADFIELRGASLRNLKRGNVKFPIGKLSVVCGVSGAGKSTLVSDLLAPALDFAAANRISKLTGTRALREKIIEDDSERAVFDELRGAENFRKIVVVSQDPIGKTSRSTPATYIGAFDLIRQIFAELPEAKIRGFGAGTFSFNTKGGRCEACAGAGKIKIEMNFVPDALVCCESCAGTRYSAELSEIRWNGKNIAEVLKMTFSEAVGFFKFHKKLQEICQLMTECGLGYLELGQPSPELSGGESQRLKLVSELVSALPSWKERLGNAAGTPLKNCYILEEPTIGLHQADCVKLLSLLHRLVCEGHTVIVVEHHLDVLAEADWLVEVGPVGGDFGGEILCQGALSKLLKCEKSPTAPFLKKLLGEC